MHVFGDLDDFEIIKNVPFIAHFLDFYFYNILDASYIMLVAIGGQRQTPQTLPPLRDSTVMSPRTRKGIS